MNRRRISALVLGLICTGAPSAHGFFEEGNDDLVRLGYLKCPTPGDLEAAELTGCNPWPDGDSSYSYKGWRDSKKSSMHYNLTAALAVAAGFDRCAAYVLALYNEVTDYATEYDYIFWAPFPEGVDEEQCGDLFAQELLNVDHGLVRPGAWVATDFTQRAFANKQGNEVERESFTFHWNLTLSSIPEQISGECSDAATDPPPLFPNRDIATLHDLHSWAVYGENPLHDCEYHNESGPYLGPISRYSIDEDPAAPGSAGAVGVYLHSLMDSYSHRACGGSTHNFNLDTTAPCGFVSGHFAGEFGTYALGQPGTGPATVRTPARLLPYRVMMHSDNTVSAALHSYQVLKEYLALNPELGRGATACPDDVIFSFAKEFATIPNFVPEEGTPSGARLRSDLADSLFESGEDCSWESVAPRPAGWRG